MKAKSKMEIQESFTVQKPDCCVVKREDSTISVLLVDDEALLLQATCQLLKRVGLKVFIAENTRQAVDIVRNEEIDFLFTDLAMPNGDGFQLLEEIVKTGKRNRITICAVSGNTETATTQKVFREGFDRFLPKPFQIEKIIRIIQNENEEQVDG